MNRLATAAAATLLVLLTACGATDTGGTLPVAEPTSPAISDETAPGPPEDSTAEPTQPGNEGSDPVARPTETGENADVTKSTITGTLGGDPQLEGGCAWIAADDGKRYEVLYPQGYEVRQEPLELVGPDGEVVASGGDTLTVTGAEATDMMSFCQIGPIFQAETVEPA